MFRRIAHLLLPVAAAVCAAAAPDGPVPERAATLSKGPPPPPLHVERGACPFECCRYGTWSSVESTAVYAAADLKSRRLAAIPPNTPFQALTGYTRTLAGVFRFSRDEGPYHPGDRIAVYNYLGEGHYRAWGKGKMTEVTLPTSPFGNQEGPSGKMEKRPVQIWWVQVSAPGGKTGWTLIGTARGLRGADACAQ